MRPQPRGPIIAMTITLAWHAPVAFRGLNGALFREFHLPR
jgi:hypothetical protein